MRGMPAGAGAAKAIAGTDAMNEFIAGIISERGKAIGIGPLSGRFTGIGGRREESEGLAATPFDFQALRRSRSTGTAWRNGCNVSWPITSQPSAALAVVHSARGAAWRRRQRQRQGDGDCPLEPIENDA